MYSPHSILTTLRSMLALLAFALTSIGLTSCLSDDLQPCPRMRLLVSVQDYNYSNASRIEGEQLKPVGAPMSTYVKSLAWHVVSVETGQTVAESPAVEASSQDTVVQIQLPTDLPLGRYAVAVWGGLEEGIPSPEILPLDDAEDPYLACDTIRYDDHHHDFHLRLRRVKSKLHIDVEGLPVQYHAVASQKESTGVYEEVDDEFRYEGDGTEVRRTRFSGSDVETQTILPPSVAYNSTRVSIQMYYPQGNPIPELDPRDVVITLYRNTITALRYVYNNDRHDFDIYVKINDEWESASQMEIE